jgi:hypothetical protein
MNRWFSRDRRLRTDGFIVRAGFRKTCALRAPTSFLIRIHTIRINSEVPMKRTLTVGSVKAGIAHCEIDSKCNNNPPATPVACYSARLEKGRPTYHDLLPEQR